MILTDFSGISDEAPELQLEWLRQASPDTQLRGTCAWFGQVRRLAYDAILGSHVEYEDQVSLIEVINLDEAAEDVRVRQKAQGQ